MLAPRCFQVQRAYACRPGSWAQHQKERKCGPAFATSHSAFSSCSSKHKCSNLCTPRPQAGFEKPSRSWSVSKCIQGYFSTSAQRDEEGQASNLRCRSRLFEASSVQVKELSPENSNRPERRYCRITAHQKHGRCSFSALEFD